MRLKITIYLFFLSFLGVAQTITINDITTGLPDAYSAIITPPYNKKAHGQFIYLGGSEITASGDITKLKFKFVNPINLSYADFDNEKTWEVRLGTTSDTYYQPSQYPNPLPATFLTGTPVFDGDITLLSDNQTIEIVLTTPFPYNSSDNLVVDIFQKSDGHANGRAKLQGFHTGVNYSDPKRGVQSTADWRGNVPSDPKRRMGEIPNITLEIVQNIPYKVDGIELTQKNAGKDINIGSTDVELIAINTKVIGSQNAKKKATALTYNLNGTQALTDLSNFKLFYGSNSDVSQATQVTGVTINTSSGTITGINQDFEAGDNYFFITADVINDGAAVGREIDAIVTDITISGVVHNSSSIAPVVPITGNTAGHMTISIDPIIVKDSNLICGTTSSSDVAPAEYDGYSGKVNSWSALMYKPVDLQPVAKKITKIGFYPTCMTSSPCSFPVAQNQTIYMKLVSSDIVASGNIDHPEGANLNGYTQVYSGPVTWNRPQNGPPSSVQPTVITLQTEFEYNGIQNVLVYYKNQNGAPLGSGWGSCKGSPTFLYSSTFGDRSIGGLSMADGTRDTDIKKGFLPITYFEYKPGIAISTPPSITKMPNTIVSVCDINDDYTVSSNDVTVINAATLKWTKSTNASGTLVNDTSLNVTYKPDASDIGKTIILTLTATNSFGSDVKDLKVKFFETPSAKIKRVK